MSRAINLRSMISADTALVRNLADSIRRAAESEAAWEGSRELLVDFSGINFISRAFAHEFLCLRHELAHRGLEVKVANPAVTIMEMLKAVSEGIGASNVKDVELPEKVDFNSLQESLESILDRHSAAA